MRNLAQGLSFVIIPTLLYHYFHFLPPPLPTCHLYFSLFLAIHTPFIRGCSWPPVHPFVIPGSRDHFLRRVSPRSKVTTRQKVKWIQRRHEGPVASLPVRCSLADRTAGSCAWSLGHFILLSGIYGLVVRFPFGSLSSRARNAGFSRPRSAGRHEERVDG